MVECVEQGAGGGRLGRSPRNRGTGTNYALKWKYQTRQLTSIQIDQRVITAATRRGLRPTAITDITEQMRLTKTDPALAARLASSV